MIWNNIRIYLSYTSGVTSRICCSWATPALLTSRWMGASDSTAFFTASRSATSIHSVMTPGTCVVNNVDVTGCLQSGCSQVRFIYGWPWKEAKATIFVTFGLNARYKHSHVRLLLVMYNEQRPVSHCKNATCLVPIYSQLPIITSPTHQLQIKTPMYAPWSFSSSKNWGVFRMQQAPRKSHWNFLAASLVFWYLARSWSTSLWRSSRKLSKTWNNSWITVANLFLEWIKVRLCPTESDNLSSTLSQGLRHCTPYAFIQ